MTEGSQIHTSQDIEIRINLCELILEKKLYIFPKDIIRENETLFHIEFPSNIKYLRTVIIFFFL